LDGFLVTDDVRLFRFSPFSPFPEPEMEAGAGAVSCRRGCPLLLLICRDDVDDFSFLDMCRPDLSSKVLFWGGFDETVSAVNYERK
jgi:hypothetical protein